MANQRWSTEKNIQFINEYHRQECLWDPKHLQYKNRDARDAAYKIIMEAMEMQCVKEVVGKIRSLRNTYNNELLKAKKSNTTGMATDDLYISKIPWLCRLDFLKNIDSYTRENTENMAVDALEKVSTQHFSNDEFDLFGQTIAEQLRQLPLEIALKTEEMILSTVRKQRIKLAKQQTSTQ
uniref:MADF domain-containing protein n=2 Tax=Bombyx mori TaxID=7091 RepID=A0A8R2M548_BOMMO|nr:uncharacterized protein LOC119628408 isoform X1 [Bombyx mori]